MNTVFCFFKETLERLKLSSPQYFKQIRNLCLALAAAGIYLKSNSVDFNICNISIVTILIGAGAFGAFLSSLPVPSTQTEELQKAINPEVEEKK